MGPLEEGSLLLDNKVDNRTKTLNGLLISLRAHNDSREVIFDTEF